MCRLHRRPIHPLVDPFRWAVLEKVAAWLDGVTSTKQSDIRPLFFLPTLIEEVAERPEHQPFCQEGRWGGSRHLSKTRWDSERGIRFPEAQTRPLPPKTPLPPSAALRDPCLSLTRWAPRPSGFLVHDHQQLGFKGRTWSDALSGCLTICSDFTQRLGAWLQFRQHLGTPESLGVHQPPQICTHRPIPTSQRSGYTSGQRKSRS